MKSYRFEELSLGMSAEFNRDVTEAMMRSFLAVSDDTNPMHTNDAYAISRGQKSKLVYGMLTASFYSQLVGVHLPGEFCLLQEVQVAFISPVAVGDRLTVRGEITQLNETFKRVTVKAYITNAAQEIVSRAQIKVSVDG